MTDRDELIAETMANELLGCNDPIETVLRPVTALQLASLIQVALRHPRVDGPARKSGESFVNQVRRYFVDQGATEVVNTMRIADEIVGMVPEPRLKAVTARCRACGAFTDDISFEYEHEQK